MIGEEFLDSEIKSHCKKLEIKQKQALQNPTVIKDIIEKGKEKEKEAETLENIVALPTDTPADIMMLSSLVKFSVIFISGIFIPVGNLPGWGLAISHVSPLTHLTDLTRWPFGREGGFWPSSFHDVLFLVGFLVGFFALAVLLNRRTPPGRP